MDQAFVHRVLIGLTAADVLIAWLVIIVVFHAYKK